MKNQLSSSKDYIAQHYSTPAISVQRVSQSLVRVCYCLGYNSFVMSRSYSSSHSHSSRSRRVSNISVTEASFQSLHLGDTVGSPQLSAPLPAYQGAAEPYRRRSPARTDPTAFYLQAGYDPGTFTRTSPSRGFTEPHAAYYSLETPNADLPAYPLDPAPTSFVREHGPSQLQAYGAVDMRYVQSSPSTTSDFNDEEVPTAMPRRPC